VKALHAQAHVQAALHGLIPPLPPTAAPAQRRQPGDGPIDHPIPTGGKR
jgi:hypothetical protein